MILGVGIWNIAESLADALITVGGIVLFAFKSSVKNRTRRLNIARMDDVRK